MAWRVVTPTPPPAPELIGATCEIQKDVCTIFRDDAGNEYLIGNHRAAGVKPGQRVTLERVQFDPCVSVWSVKI